MDTAACYAVLVNKAELGALIDFNVRQYELAEEYVKRKSGHSGTLTPCEKGGRFPVVLRVRASKLRRRAHELRALFR